jgi:hypothetical protein
MPLSPRVGFPELPLGSRRRGGIKAMALRVALVGGSAVISDASLIPRCNCSCGGSLQGVLWRGPHRHPPSGVECTQSQKLSKLKLEIQVGGIVASCRSRPRPPPRAAATAKRVEFIFPFPGVEARRGRGEWGRRLLLWRYVGVVVRPADAPLA